MFTAYPPAPPEVEQAAAEPAAPEAVEAPPAALREPETESANVEREVMEPEPPPTETAQGEIPGGETGSAAAEETDATADDLDLEFDIDTVFEEEEEAPAEAAADDIDALGEVPAEPEAALPDAAMDGSPAPVETEAVTEGADADAVEEAFEMETEAGKTPTEDAEAGDTAAEELDLDFDLDMAPEGEAAAGEEAAAEELDLSDIELSMDAGTEAGDTAAEELDLDFDFDMAPEGEAAAGEEAAPEELDLSDIELSMDDGTEAATGAGEKELDFDLDLDMDSEPQAEPVSTEEKDDIDSEELDFSDFEETVMLDSPPDLETERVSGDLEEELELDLEMEDVSRDAESEPPSMKKEDVELEDLDFDLEMEFEGDAADDTAGEDEGDVDLSDIEKMLEDDGEEAETISLSPDQSDIETEVEKWKESPGADDLMDQTGEIDLSDIMIDVDDDGMEEDIENVELDLDIDESSEPVKTRGGARKPEEIDISGFEEFDIPEEGDHVQGDFSGGDIELEFEVDEDTDELDEMATVSDAEEIGAGSETIAYSEPLVDREETPVKKKGKKKKVKKIKPVRRSGILRPVILLLLLIALPLAAIVLLDRFMDINVPYATDYLKQIPYLNQMMKPEMAVEGEVRIENISSKFIDNASQGKLFIITGMVKNEFPESRKYIKIRGSLFSAGKKLAKTVTVYAGNVISDANLSEMSLTDINKSLSKRFGDEKSNFDVKPGRSIPFMIVFSDLPESLEEFTIEAAGSFPVTAQE